MVKKEQSAAKGARRQHSCHNYEKWNTYNRAQLPSEIINTEVEHHNTRSSVELVQCSAGYKGDDATSAASSRRPNQQLLLTGAAAAASTSSNFYCLLLLLLLPSHGIICARCIANPITAPPPS
jgi:hypothetical protein